MEILKDVVYEAGHERGTGDFIIPDDSSPKPLPLALVIHGGGWNAMDKASLRPVAKVLAEMGFLCFCPNYRLLDMAPWPACGDDCLLAAHFLVKKAAKFCPGAGKPPILVVGASAGGHLALMTGLRLPPEQIMGIVSIAGIADVKAEFEADNEAERRGPKLFGKAEISDAEWTDVSPINHVTEKSPRIFCIHSCKDTLVYPSNSERLVAKCASLGVKADNFVFEGNDDQHGMWLPFGKDTPMSERILLPPVEKRLREIASEMAEDYRLRA